jgi:UDP-sugar pyrophosphorylase
LLIIYTNLLWVSYFAKVPTGQKVDFNNLSELDQLESVGLELIKDTCFVLVAGGLGERLGFDGIKISIPMGKQSLIIIYFIKHD